MMMIMMMMINNRYYYMEISVVFVHLARSRGFSGSPT